MLESISRSEGVHVLMPKECQDHFERFPNLDWYEGPQIIGSRKAKEGREFGKGQVMLMLNRTSQKVLHSRWAFPQQASGIMPRIGAKVTAKALPKYIESQKRAR